MSSGFGWVVWRLRELAEDDDDEEDDEEEEEEEEEDEDASESCEGNLRMIWRVLVFEV